MGRKGKKADLLNVTAMMKPILKRRYQLLPL
jgi:hypothetical protein